MKTRLTGQSLIYVLTSLASGALPFFLLPILTRYLSPEDYGRVALFQVLMTLMGPFVGLSLQGLVMKRYFAEPDTLPRLVFHIVLWIAGISSLLLLFLAVLAAVAPQWSIEVLALDPTWTAWAIVASALQFLVQIRLTLWQAAARPWAYGALQITQTGLNLGLSLLFVVSAGMGFEGRLAGQLVAMGLTAAFAVVSLIVKREIQPVFHLEEFKHCLRFGAPLIPHALGGWIMSMADRLFLNQISGVATTGVYAAAAQLAQILGTILISINNAVQPWMFGKLANPTPENRHELKRTAWVLGAGLLIGCLVFAIAVPPLSLWFLGEKFRGAEQFLWIFAFWKFFEGIAYFAGNFLFFYGRTTRIAGATLFAALTHLTACWIWIPIREAQGLAAQGATEVGVFSTTVSTLLVVVFARNAFREASR